MSKRSKRWEYLRGKVDELGVVTLATAVNSLKGLESSLPKTIKPCKFDQTVEVAVRLGVRDVAGVGPHGAIRDDSLDEGPPT